jgi:hypothetical protein
MADDDRLVPDLPPHDEHLERGVLGAILAQPDREHAAALLTDLAFLEPGDFWRGVNREVYFRIEALRVREGSCLIGDLFRLDGTDSAYLTGLVVEASPALVVKQEALRLADLGMERLLLWGAARLARWTPAQVEGFNDRVQAKRDRIATARDGRRPPADAAFDLLAGR